MDRGTRWKHVAIFEATASERDGVPGLAEVLHRAAEVRSKPRPFI